MTLAGPSSLYVNGPNEIGIHSGLMMMMMMTSMFSPVVLLRPLRLYGSSHYSRSLASTLDNRSRGPRPLRSWLSISSAYRRILLVHRTPDTGATPGLAEAVQESIDG
jgi:hypothetical protein